MNLKQSGFRSLASQFRRDYFIVSIVPVLLLFTVFIVGAMVTRDYLADLIVQSTSDLNQEAEHHLQELGEQIILMKARDVAKQLEVYFRMYPNKIIEEMRDDPVFMDIAIQKVGETGYTAVTEAYTYLFRVHPNEKLNDRDMRFLAKQMPTWWKIIEEAIDGDETVGYYDWLEPDGSVRQKFLATTPVSMPLHGITVMASATTYIDEFSTPVKDMKLKAENIVRLYQRYIARQSSILIIVAVAVILMAFYGIYLLGRKAASRFIMPIMQLADTADHLGEGKWDLALPDNILQRQDEIGTLAQAFNSMSGQLKTLFSSLEKKVNELKQVQEALKKSEEELRALYEESKRAEELYRSLIHSSADAIVIYDLEDRVTYISPMFTTLFGWASEELEGRSIPFIPESEQDATMEMRQKVIDHGKPCQGFETRRMTKDGRLMDVSLSASRYDDHEGHPAGMLAIFRDISERKRLETQLHHIERMEAIGTLAGGIAHDFNNLLMAIQGNVTEIRYDMKTSHHHYKYLVNIEKQVERGASLTRQLLGYARKGKYEVKPLNLNDILSESAETFQRTRKDITIHHDLSMDLFAIEADPAQMEQVLMNLFINASDAMTDAGELFLKTDNVSSEEMSNKPFAPKPGDYILLTVRDTGSGMDQKTMERIFDPFFTTKAMGRGTGLGLASVYGIVKGHGGYIEVDSEKGVGTTFKIYLPASKKAVETSVTEPEEVVQGTGTILLVDDEDIILETGARMLEILGYTVLKAESGKMAIKLYEKHNTRIDLIILDMILPDMGGGIIFDRLREINPKAAVLLSSGYSIDGKATDILNRGCIGFIQKPYTLKQLSRKLRSILKDD
ncbi:MAG: PAS domain S-box protein [Deltaproteobacteria bacterium]|nr:PAS domain S-box protein [Deltaproteobacteria bacterium]